MDVNDLEEKVKLIVRVPPSLKKKLKIRAASQEISMGRLIARYLENGLSEKNLQNNKYDYDRS